MNLQVLWSGIPWSGFLSISLRKEAARCIQALALNRVPVHFSLSLSPQMFHLIRGKGCPFGVCPWNFVASVIWRGGVLTVPWATAFPHLRTARPTSPTWRTRRPRSTGSRCPPAFSTAPARPRRKAMVPTGLPALLCELPVANPPNNFAVAYSFACPSNFPGEIRKWAIQIALPPSSQGKMWTTVHNFVKYQAVVSSINRPIMLQYSTEQKC